MNQAENTPKSPVRSVSPVRPNDGKIVPMETSPERASSPLLFKPLSPGLSAQSLAGQGLARSTSPLLKAPLIPTPFHDNLIRLPSPSRDIPVRAASPLPASPMAVSPKLAAASPKAVSPKLAAASPKLAASSLPPSDSPRIASPQIKAASPQIKVASPQMKAASPQIKAASPQIKAASPEIKAASLEMKAASPKMMQASPKMETPKLMEQRLPSPQVKHESLVNGHPSPAVHHATPSISNETMVHRVHETESADPSGQAQSSQEISYGSTDYGFSGQDTGDSEALVRDQFKFLLSLLRNMKKRKDATPFLVPVDPAALNIPTYFTVVKHPMDLSTIERKFNFKTYQTVQEVVDDFNLMIDNCVAFNGPMSVVGSMAVNLRHHFNKEYEKLPRVVRGPPKKKSLSDRLSFAERPKRDVNPISRDPSLSANRKGGRAGVELKFCGNVLRELMSKKHQPYNFPFLAPVDPVALGIPTYYSVIKQPMDLSTIKRRLEHNEYECADDFEMDVRLMFNNCYTFNGPVAEVSRSARHLESSFENKWAGLNSFVANYAEPRPRQKSFSNYDYDVPGDDMEVSDDDDEDLQHINMIKSQLSLLTSQMKMLQEKRAKKLAKKRASYAPPPVAAPAPSYAAYPAPTASKPKPKVKKQKRKREEDQPEPAEISYEQKRELSEKINVLSQDKLMHVFEIIKENTNLNNASGEDEIELDIDSLSKSVLWKLYLYVRKHSNPAKKARTDKKRADSPNSSGSDSDDSAFEQEAYENKRAPVPAPIPMPAAKKTVKKRDDAFVPFRQEAGDTTLLRTEEGRTPAPVFKQNKKAEVKVANPVQTKRPTYESLLDSAWDHVETLKSEEKPLEKTEKMEKEKSYSSATSPQSVSHSYASGMSPPRHAVDDSYVLVEPYSLIEPYALVEPFVPDVYPVEYLNVQADDDLVNEFAEQMFDEESKNPKIKSNNGTQRERCKNILVAEFESRVAALSS